MYDYTHWTQSDLIQHRGWTQTLIDRYLGWPDARADNPHHPYGAPVRLYAIDRVLDAEVGDAADGLARAAEQRATRRAGALRAAATRRERRAREEAQILAALEEITFVAGSVR